MKIFSTEIYFDSIYKTRYGSYKRGTNYGSGYCEEQERYNRMIRTIKFFGKKVFKYVMEYEHIPSNVWISIATVGYDTSGWKSKWRNHPNFKCTFSY